MQTISPDTVERVWRQRIEISPEEIEPFAIEMEGEQPGLLAYLLAAGEENFSDDEQALMLYMGLNIWEMMRQGVSGPKAVPVEAVDVMESRNITDFAVFQGQSAQDIETGLSKLIEKHTQPYVLGYAINMLAQEEETGENIQEENKARIFFYLKTMVDCLDQHQ